MRRRGNSDFWGSAAALVHTFPRPGGVCWPIIAGTALGLAACSQAPGSFDVVETPQAKLSSLMAMVQFKKAPNQQEPLDHVVCPNIVILDGTADDRVYGSGAQNNANLRYQFSLYDVARDCRVEGNQINLKIGAAGKVLLGPAGTPGNFTAPVRVAIVRDSNQDAVVSKLYRVPADIPSGKSEAPFTLVTDSLSVPYTHPHAERDYTIKVGFDAQGNAPEKKRRQRHPR